MGKEGGRFAPRPASRCCPALRRGPAGLRPRAQGHRAAGVSSPLARLALVPRAVCGMRAASGSRAGARSGHGPPFGFLAGPLRPRPRSCALGRCASARLRARRSAPRRPPGAACGPPSPAAPRGRGLGSGCFGLRSGGPLRAAAASLRGWSALLPARPAAPVCAAAGVLPRAPPVGPLRGLAAPARGALRPGGRFSPPPPGRGGWGLRAAARAIFPKSGITYRQKGGDSRECGAFQGGYHALFCG